MSFNANTNSSYNSNSSNSNNNNNSSYSSNNNSFDRWNSSSIMANNSSSNDGVELLQDQVAHLKREYEGLKQRFSDLSRLRISEPEEILQDYKKLSQTRDEAAQKTISNLQRENEELKQQLKQKEEQAKTAVIQDDSSLDSNSESLNESELMEIEKILKIYSNFSGLKITPKPESPLTHWHCEFNGRSGSFDFELNHQAQLGKYQYIPVIESSKTKQKLPQFLTSDMLIAPDQMQIFFWRLLDTLSKQQQQIPV